MSEEVNNDPFHPDNVAKVQLIVLMRIYDVQMAILANLNEDGEKASEYIHQQHQLGKIVGSLPWLDLSDEQD